MSTIKHRANQWGKWFQVSILHGKAHCTYQTLKSERIGHEGRVYCLTVPSGMFLARQDDRIFVTGNCDAIAVYQACGGFVSSVPNGANGHKSEGAIYPGKDTGFQYLWGPDGKLISELDQFDKIILATDADEKGFLLRDELALRIGRGRCWFFARGNLFWPY